MTWNDHPSPDDFLGRDRLVGALHYTLCADPLATPMVASVYGGWGSGKTTVMRMLEKRLRDEPEVLTLWFDAWKYGRTEQTLWRALLLRLIEALKNSLPDLIEVKGSDREKANADLDKKFEEMRASLYRSQSFTEKGGFKVNWSAAVPFVVGEALDLIRAKGVLKEIAGEDDIEDAMKVIERQEITRYREQVTSLEQFENALRVLIDEHIVKPGRTLFIFIDDLDRCLPEEAVGALEAVKLFLDFEGCVFILGMDREVVERGIFDRYPPIQGPDDEKPISRIDPRQYLDKIIQLPITLPPLTSAQVGRYLDELFRKEGVHTLLPACRKLIEIAAPPNPRTLKRVLNVLSLLLSLDLVDDGEDVKRLAKIVLMQVLFDDAYKLAEKKAQDLIQMELAAQQKGSEEDIKELVLRMQRLPALLAEPPMFGDVPDRLSDLVALTSVTSTHAKIGMASELNAASKVLTSKSPG